MKIVISTVIKMIQPEWDKRPDIVTCLQLCPQYFDDIIYEKLYLPYLQ